MKTENELIVTLKPDEFDEIASGRSGAYFMRKNTTYWYNRFMDKAGKIKHKHITLKRGSGKNAKTMPCQISYIRIMAIWVDWAVDGVEEYIFINIV